MAADSRRSCGNKRNNQAGFDKDFVDVEKWAKAVMLMDAYKGFTGTPNT